METTRYPIPQKVGRIPVYCSDAAPAKVNGEEWVDLWPEDETIERGWFFSLTTGKIIRHQ